MSWATVITTLCFFLALQTTNTRQRKPPANKAPVIAQFQSSDTRVWTCGEHAFCDKKKRRTVSLQADASDPENDPLTYEYSVTGGEVIGSGRSVSWRIGDQKIGKYSVTVKVSDSKGASTSATIELIVSRCLNCGIPDPPCPLVAVFTYSEFTEPTETYRGEQLRFNAKVSGDINFVSRPDYVWTVTNGKLLKGQHTPWIQVEATGEVGQEVVAKVEVEGFDPSCSKAAEARVPIKQ